MRLPTLTLLALGAGHSGLVVLGVGLVVKELAVQIPRLRLRLNLAGLLLLATLFLVCVLTVFLPLMKIREAIARQ